MGAFLQTMGLLQQSWGEINTKPCRISWSRNMPEKTCRDFFGEATLQKKQRRNNFIFRIFGSGHGAPFYRIGGNYNKVPGDLSEGMGNGPVKECIFWGGMVLVQNFSSLLNHVPCMILSQAKT